MPFNLNFNVRSKFLHAPHDKISVFNIYFKWLELQAALWLKRTAQHIAAVGGRSEQWGAERSGSKNQLPGHGRVVCIRHRTVDRVGVWPACCLLPGAATRRLPARPARPVRPARPACQQNCAEIALKDTQLLTAAG